MSLIIAKVEGSGCLFISDTKVSINNGDPSVTADGKIRMPPEYGILKIHILTPRICVAFAGDVSLCTNTIQSFIIRKPQTPIGILQHFQNELIKYDSNSAFLLCLADPDKGPFLYRIDKNSMIHGYSFWIGEAKAFSEFQSFFLQPRESGVSTFNHATASFKKLVDKTIVKTVGDFVISAYFNHDYQSFIYEEAAVSSSGFKIRRIKGGVWTALDEGSVMDGACVIASLISNDLGKPAICLFFEKGDVAFLYFPISASNVRVSPVVLSGIDRHTLKRRVKEEYGIELIGMLLQGGRFEFMQ